MALAFRGLVERDLRLLAVGMAIRTFGAALYNPFLALFLYAILHVGYLEIGIIFVGIGVVQLPFGLVGGLWTDRVGRDVRRSSSASRPRRSSPRSWPTRLRFVRWCSPSRSP